MVVSAEPGPEGVWLAKNHVAGILIQVVNGWCNDVGEGEREA
jgi:hypothetical protein